MYKVFSHFRVRVDDFSHENDAVDMCMPFKSTSFPILKKGLNMSLTHMEGGNDIITSDIQTVTVSIPIRENQISHQLVRLTTICDENPTKIIRILEKNGWKIHEGEYEEFPGF